MGALRKGRGGKPMAALAPGAENSGAFSRNRGE
jgi:hypothetical protein